MALASVAPPSTVVRTPVSAFWKAGFSWLAPRISRHCTSGRPASIITENWRKKMAMSLVATLPEPKVGRENSLPFSFMELTVMCSLASCACNTCLLVDTRSPPTFSPATFVPENVNTGIVTSLYRVLSRESRVLRMALAGSGLGTGGFRLFLARGRRGRTRRRTPGEARAPVDHLLQFFRQRGPLYGGLQRNLLAQVQRGQ